MKRFKRRETNINSECIYSEDECFELLYNGCDLSEIIFTKSDDFKSKYEELYFEPFLEQIEDISDTCHEKRSKTWFIPEEFKHIDIEKYISELCVTDIEKERVNQELELYKQRNLLPMLQFIIFFVSYLRKNNHIWGVGRGSSVNSYVLYLIGLHKIDSIKYNLDINDFLR